MIHDQVNCAHRAPPPAGWTEDATAHKAPEKFFVYFPTMLTLADSALAMARLSLHTLHTYPTPADTAAAGAQGRGGGGPGAAHAHCAGPGPGSYEEAGG